MGFARKLLRAALDLPIEKPAITEPPRSLGIRMLKGAINFVADSQIGVIEAEAEADRRFDSAKYWGGPIDKWGNSVYQDD